MQLQSRTLSAGALLLALPTLSSAQGGDDCNVPTVITAAGVYPYDSTGASSSGFDGNGGAPCAPNGNPFESDLFWVYTPAGNGTFGVSTCGGATYDTQISVHVGADCTAFCLDYNDQDCGNQSTVAVSGVAATSYLIQVGGWSTAGFGTEGPGSLTVTIAGPPPANDTCATPTAASGLGSFAYDRTDATTSGFDGGDPLTCGIAQAGPGGRDVFIAWTATASGNYILDNCGEGNDTVMNVHLGADCAAACIVAADGGLNCNTGESTVSLPGVVSGQTYLVQVSDWATNQFGTAVGTLNVVLAPPPPANDTCATPEPIAGLGTFLFNNSGATTTGFNGGEFASNGIHPCFPHDSQTGLEQQIARDMFYVWTAPCSGSFQIDTEGTTGISDTKINIHSGVDCGALCYQGDDDDGTGLLSMVMLAGVTAGDQFLIQVGTYFDGNVPGDGLLNINSLGVCPTSSTSIVCDPPMPHYLGGTATLSGSTLGNAFGSGLHLECTGGPPAEFGFFMVSSTANASLNIFNGTLCLDLPAGRYNPNVATNQANPELNSLAQFDANGVLLSIVGNGMGASQNGFNVPSELPFAPSGQLISIGDTYFFQCWYRDQVGPFPNPGSSANFSNVLQVQF